MSVAIAPEMQNLFDKPAEKFAKRVIVFTGFSCSNNCCFCAVESKRPAVDKTTEEVLLEMDRSYERGARQIVFSGGECTLREDIVDLVRAARQKGFADVHIQSNGRRFADIGFCKKMFAAGMSYLGTSIHGPTGVVHDGLTSRPGSLREVVEGIHNLKRLARGRIGVAVNSVIVRQNFLLLPDTASLLVRLRPDLLQFAFVHACGFTEERFSSFVPRKTDVVAYVKQGVDIAVSAGIPVMVEAIPYCLLPGYEKHCSDRFIPSTDVIEPGREILNYEQVRLRSSKRKFARCQDCRFDAICEGPWQQYPEHYGDEEFQPVEAEYVNQRA